MSMDSSDERDGKQEVTGTIRVGIGGWNYEPWRETFYPQDVAKSAELEYASRQVTAIEINSTFYRLQSPDVYAKWRDDTPEHFMFTVKAPRFVTQRRVLSEGAEGVKRFIKSGVGELGDKLGAVMWQLDPRYPFDANNVAAFLEGLPRKSGSTALRHALNARNQTFRNERFVELARQFEVAIVCEDDSRMTPIADLTADFVYARLRRSQASEPTGYAPDALQEWMRRAGQWAAGSDPEDLPHAGAIAKKSSPRDVFIYFINGAKERAPAAALALLEKLKDAK
jgi:uncharacterized protein YecE (DUF72 family)